MMHEALEAAVEMGDSAAAARLRLEAQARRSIEEAESVAEAFKVLERAVSQGSPRGMQAFAERVARLHARALVRLGREERRAVRAIVRRGWC